VDILLDDFEYGEIDAKEFMLWVEKFINESKITIEDKQKLCALFTRISQGEILSEQTSGDMHLGNIKMHIRDGSIRTLQVGDTEVFIKPSPEVQARVAQWELTNTIETVRRFLFSGPEWCLVNIQEIIDQADQELNRLEEVAK
jgi:hypothetical protein